MKYFELNEAVTTRGFKFGFEFECIGPSGFNIKDANLPLQLKYHRDTSIKPENDNEFGYEFVSEPLVLNPKSILDSKNTILELLKDGFYTNSSCGFHIHYSYDDISFEDIAWILVGLSLDTDSQEQFSKFEDINFFNDSYASLDIFDVIKECFEEDRLESLIYLIDDYKYRILRVHPQGTLEWRGPRDFMNKKEQGVISNFFVRMYKCANLIDSLVQKKSWEYAGVSISKDKFVKMMSNSAMSKVSQKEYSNQQKEMNIDKRAIEKYKWIKGINFSGKVLYEDGDVIFSEGDLSKSNIRNRVYMEDVTVNECKVENSSFANCRVNNSIVNNSEFHYGKISNSKINKSSIPDNVEVVKSIIDGEMTTSQDKKSNMFGDDNVDIED